MNGSADGPAGAPGAARRGAFVGAVTLAAVALAVVFFLASFPKLWYDSRQYHALSKIVASRGPWGLHHAGRSYGYPLFVALCTALRPATPAVTHALVFGAQLLIYLAACFAVAGVAGRVFGSERFFRGTYALTSLNPVALIHTTEVLTDLLSAVLLALPVFLSLERPRPARRAFRAFLAAGAAIAVRPANVVLLPALCMIWILRARLYRERIARSALAAAAALALPLLPQLASNVSAFHAWTPLVVDKLYAEQTRWGMWMLKYATLVVPHEDARLVYRNPYYPAGATSPREFWRRDRRGYLKTLTLHAFALFDQDLPFAYSADPHPWYRWPLSIANYAYLFLAGLGFVLVLRRLVARPPEIRLYAIGALAVSLAYVALYLPVAVESRFSLPLYLLWAPAVVFAAGQLADGARQRRPEILWTALAGVAFVAACVRVSLWLTHQAPTLVHLASP